VVADGVVRLADGSELRARTNGSQGPIAIDVRPEKIALGEGGANRLRGTVKAAAYIGVATEVVVETAVGELTVFHQNVEAGGVVPPLGSPVTVSWVPEATFVVESGKESTE
jgi:ABC-type Fe3+/spermidine/putrescine transport system ATPase subunit